MSDARRQIDQRRAEGKHGLTGKPLVEGMLSGERASSLSPEWKIQRFLENALDARENGYEFVCAECGAGIYDDSDDHDQTCSHA